MDFYLAIDLGTTGCRSILFDENLTQLAASYEEYGLVTPREGWAEQDANLWWDMTLRTGRQAILESGVDGKLVKGISISSQGITIVPVDEQLEPLCAAINWLDRRAVEEAEQIDADFGAKEMYRRTGRSLSPGYTLPKLLWLQKNRPELYEKAWKILLPMEFLVGKLTGNCVTDHSMASGTMLYDLHTMRWDREVLAKYGIDGEKLPAIACAGTCAGTVLPQVADALGITTGCVVAVGAQDQKAAAFGAGLADGVMTISLGTAAAITKRWTEVHSEENHGVAWCSYVEPDTYVTEGVVNTAATCLRWVRDLAFPGESYDVINEEALAARERGSSVQFHPLLGGPSDLDRYPESCGCFYGLGLASNRGDMALAVMEGVAFCLRAVLEAMEAYGNVHTLILFGGGSRSQLWRQIIADVTKMKLCCPTTPEAAGAGAARLAALAAGKDLPPLPIAHTGEPGEKAEYYEEKYQKFRSIEQKLWEA